MLGKMLVCLQGDGTSNKSDSVASRGSVQSSNDASSASALNGALEKTSPLPHSDTDVTSFSLKRMVSFALNNEIIICSEL